MEIGLKPIREDHPEFAGEVSGCDLRVPASDELVALIEDAIDQFGVLVFRDQLLDDAQQLAFTENFGPLETTTADIVQGKARRLSDQVNDISNLSRDGTILAQDDRKRLFNLGNMLWHSDSSYKYAPAKYSLLSARVIPSYGGDTEFADMRAAYDALGADLKARIADLVCEHSALNSRAVLGFLDWTADDIERNRPVRQRLVRRHPVTRRHSLFLSSHADGILGLALPEARMLLRDLTEHATRREFVYTHHWRQHDLVMWDNRVTMHRARSAPPDQIRDLHRTTAAGAMNSLQE